MDHSRDHFNDSSRVDRNDLPELSELVFPSPSLTTRSSCSFEILKKVLFDEVEGQIGIFEECAAKVEHSRYCHTALSKVELFESLIGNELRDNAMTPEVVGTILRKFPLNGENRKFYGEFEGLLGTLFSSIPSFNNPHDPHSLVPQFPVNIYFNVIRSIAALRKQLDIHTLTKKPAERDELKYFLPQDATRQASFLLVKIQALDGLSFLPAPVNARLALLDHNPNKCSLDRRTAEAKALEAWGLEVLSTVLAHKRPLEILRSALSNLSDTLRAPLPISRACKHDLQHLADHLARTLSTTLRFTPLNASSIIPAVHWAVATERLELELKDFSLTLRERLEEQKRHLIAVD